jgi:hypothetical protein
MGTANQHFALVRIGNSSWAAVHVSRVSADGRIYTHEPESSILRTTATWPGRVVAQSAAAHDSFAQRFPRIRMAIIALALLTVSATALTLVGAAIEIELLRHGGMLLH